MWESVVVLCLNSARYEGRVKWIGSNQMSISTVTCFGSWPARFFTKLYKKTWTTQWSKSLGFWQEIAFQNCRAVGGNPKTYLIQYKAGSNPFGTEKSEVRGQLLHEVVFKDLVFKDILETGKGGVIKYKHREPNNTCQEKWGKEKSRINIASQKVNKSWVMKQMKFCFL